MERDRYRDNKKVTGILIMEKGQPSKLFNHLIILPEYHSDAKKLYFHNLLQH